MSQADYKALAALNDWIRRVSHIMGTLYCDTNAAVSDPHDPTKLASSPDGLHPDPSGYRKMGEALARAIEEDQVRDFTE